LVVTLCSRLGEAEIDKFPLKRENSFNRFLAFSNWGVWENNLWIMPVNSLTGGVPAWYHQGAY
jgi:hypothetical protein